MHAVMLNTFVCIASLSFFLPTYAIVVNTKYGPVRGVTTDKAHAFLGIPFAAPPVGNLRWQTPKDPNPWEPYILDTTVRKPGCPQYACDYESLLCVNETSEDCLYLYIWTPLQASAFTSYPVMVFIHGGSFIFGGAGARMSDGENFVNKGNVILVGANYRLGALGFFLSSKLQGNYALHDQRKALQWVQENIQNFGGDRNQVTLFGQSAGAQSTLIHMMSSESAQYFKQAIVLSAPMAIPFYSEPEMLKVSRVFAENLDCDLEDLKCLKSKSEKEIMIAQRKVVESPLFFSIQMFEPWAPYIDGDILPSRIMDFIKTGYSFLKPMIIGTVTEETRLFIYALYKKTLSEGGYNLVIKILFHENYMEVLSTYPAISEVDQRENLEEVSTDSIFTCPARNYTLNYSLIANNVWYYVFDHALSFDPWKTKSLCDNHVCHGSELPILFDTAGLGNHQMTLGEVRLSNEMRTYLTNFAKTSDPNIGREIDITWPSYSSTARSCMLFQTPNNEIRNDYKKRKCDFWDSIGY